MPQLIDGLNDLKVPYGKAFIRVVQGKPIVAELDYKLPDEMVVAAIFDHYHVDVVLGVTQERIRLPMVIFRVDTKELLTVPAKVVQYEILQWKAAP